MFVYDNYNSTKIYNAGIYLRLSREDENTGQSESIDNQKKLLERFVIEQGWNLVKVYIDDGYSGMNFDRPGFKSMISDVECKKINLVLTKDLSRLGRDYIETGFYLERYFPEKDVRYIALSDNIDTGLRNNSGNDLTPFKAVINDMYARDISKKIRIVLDSKRKNGEFIGSFAPYGYKKNPKNKNKLIIDKEVSGVIQRIFNMYVDGESMGAIAKILNQEKVPSPMAYKEQSCNYANVNARIKLWSQCTVRDIMKNQMYIGNLVQGRAEKISYKTKKLRAIPRENWIIVENMHEAIIDKAQFDLVQDMIAKNVVTYAKKDEERHLLNGLVFCKECGSKFTYRRNKGEMMMNCIKYWRFGFNEYCSSHLIKEKTLDNLVVSELKKISKALINEEFYKEFEGMRLVKEPSNYEEELSRISNRLIEIKRCIKAIYEDKIKGLITDDIFTEMTSDYNIERENLTQREKVVCGQKSVEDKKVNKQEDYKQLLKSIANFDIVEKSIICQLVERVEVDKDKNITVCYNFDNPFGKNAENV